MHVQVHEGQRAGQSSLLGFTRGEGLCDLTSHCSLLLLGRYKWGASPLLFCIVIWCLTRRPGCYMSHMSVTGSTEFMKGSVDGGVYYRIHERERLSFGKICFYGVRTHQGLQGSSKKHSFFRLISLNSTILVVVPLHVGFRGALDHPTQAVSRGN